MNTDKSTNQKVGRAGIDHVHLKSSDVEKSIKFYVALGATVEARYSYEGMETTALMLGGMRLNISSGREPGRPVFDHVGITVPELDIKYEDLTKAGGKLIKAPSDWEPDDVLIPSDRLPLRGRFAFVEGPDGEFVELVSPRG